jgi:hypothetical protein
MKYAYPRADLTIRISADLLDLIHEMSYNLAVSVQDIGVFALLMLLDRSETICPDWKTISPVLTTSEKLVTQLANPG